MKIKVLYITANGGMWGDNKALLNLLDNMTSVTPFVILGNDGLFRIELEKRAIAHTIVKNYLSVWPGLTSFRDVILFLPRLGRMLLANYLALKKLQVIIAKVQPQILHTNIGPVHLGHFLSKKYKIKNVWHLREFQIADFNMHPFPTLNSFLRKIHQPNNHIIAISKCVAEYFKLSSNNSCVIYDGVLDSSQSIKINIHKEKYFLFVGRISIAKGVDELVRVFSKFCKKNTDFRLKIIGTGSSLLENELRSFINNEGIENRVDFLGFLSNVDEFMQKAYATVVASKNEAFGFVTIEALSNGCLVIGKATAGTKEILKNGEYGLIYRNEDELLSMLHKVAQTPVEEFIPLISRAQEYVYSNYTVARSAMLVEQLYRQILQNQ